MTENQNIPEKFKTKDGGVNIDAVLKSYAELERKLGSAPVAPKDASEYPAPGFGDAEDDSIRRKFLDMGLTCAQAEKICQAADELIRPLLEDMASSRDDARELAELEKFFGGADKVAPALVEIEAFGKKYLPAEAFESLCGTHQGICGLYRMMKSEEPGISTSRNRSDNLSESDLKNLMRDPKYWRDHDAEFVRMIESGFKKLFS
ncbi:MAG: hypothetical protein LBH81_00075 [Rickettsiales bacterium]|jgi:hypothetical protein|nr:hypothetical protein [Rickettsiales bacterium]